MSVITSYSIHYTKLYELCPHCREPYTPLPELVRELELERYASGDRLQLWRAPGCSQCQGSGYYGRLVIHELLQMNDEIRRLALDHADAGRIQHAAKAAGMRTMYEDGCAKALAGLTNLEEVRNNFV